MSISRLWYFIVVLCLASLNDKAVFATDVENSATLYHSLTLIDGTGAAPRADAAILVEGGSIKAVGPTVGMLETYGARARLVDGSSLYALPGLIDTHVHMATQPKPEKAAAWLKRYIYSGITSVRDMAGDMRLLSELARQSRTGKTPAPDLYYAALMAGPSFFVDPRPGSAAEGEKPGHVPWMQAITADTDMVEAVTLARGTYATGIKIYANLSASAIRRITMEAHRQSFRVWAHSMVFPATPRDVVAAGVDVMSHVCRLAWQLSEEKPEQYHHKIALPYESLDIKDERLQRMFAEMKQRGIILDATLWLYSHQEERRKKRPSSKPGPAACPAGFAAALTAAVHKSGVEISTGTDVIMPLDVPYPALFKELETLVENAGFTPLEAIRSATLVGARVLGIEAQTGTIEAGKRADLLFVDKNPLEDITNLRSIVMTIKKGEAYKRTDYAPTAKHHTKE